MHLISSLISQFPIRQFLSQLFLTRLPEVIWSPYKFWYPAKFKHSIQHLEKCWENDYIQFLEKCLSIHCSQLHWYAGEGGEAPTMQGSVRPAPSISAEGEPH
jgi:hypothetical protein